MSENVTNYEGIVKTYNHSGEVLSERMMRDIFVMALPTKARTGIFDNFRRTENASYKDAKILLREMVNLSNLNK